MPTTDSLARQMIKDKYGFTDDEKLILAYREDPILACKEILGVNLAWFQRIVMRGLWKTPFVLLLLGRGCSKTSLTTMYMILKAMLYPKMKIGCLGPSFRQAQYVFDEIISEHWPNSPYLRASCIFGKHSGPSVGTMRAILRFSNGSYIEALPLGNDGGKARGRRYNLVFIDEFADVTEQVVNQVVQPFLNVEKPGMNNQMIIASTARYKWNHLWPKYVFYKAKAMKLNEDTIEYLRSRNFVFEPKVYDVFEYDLRDVNIDPNAPFRIKEMIIEDAFVNMTKDEFGMENLNLFPDDTSGFFPSELVMSTAVSREEDYQVIKFADKDDDTFYIFGIDVARSDDPMAANFCLQIMRIKGSQKNLCKTITTHGATYQEMLSVIRKAHIDFDGPFHRVKGIWMDAAGGGTTIRDLLTEKWTDKRTHVEYDPIIEEEDENFEHIESEFKMLHLQNQTDTFNNHMFHSLKADLEQGRTILPMHFRNDRDKEMEKVGREVAMTKTELMVLEIKPTKAGFTWIVPKGYQKDRAVALGLSNYGANLILGGEIVEETPDLPAGYWV